MNNLETYFRQNTGRMIQKWHHYFDVYDRHFSCFIGKEPVILEIGIFQGGSLQMWKNYFGEKARIYAIDIDPRCQAFEEDNVKIFIGSQSDREFLRKIIKEIPPIDILIDDGGHTMKQQIVSFEELFDYVKEGGVYVCEDCHTSYWSKYGGGYKRRGTFIEYSKNWIDYLNAYHSKTKRLQVTNFTRSVKSVHYYDSVVVVEKGKVTAPADSRTGNASFDFSKPKKTFPEKMRRFPIKIVNEISRIFRLPYHID